MNDDQKREEVKKVYPGPGWSEKVDKMPPEQVAALYIKFQSQGKLGK